MSYPSQTYEDFTARRASPPRLLDDLRVIRQLEGVVDEIDSTAGSVQHPFGSGFQALCKLVFSRGNSGYP